MKKRDRLFKKTNYSTITMFIIGILSIILFVFGDRMWRVNTSQFVPLLDNIALTRSYLTKGHLMFERLILGDPSIRDIDVWPIFDRAELAISDSINGHSNITAISGIALKEKGINTQLRQLEAGVKQFRVNINNRWKNRERKEHSNIISERKSFYDIERQIESLEYLINVQINRMIKNQSKVTYSILTVWIIIIICVVLMLYYANTKRAQLEKKLLDHRVNLEKTVQERTIDLKQEITERKHAEEQIKVSLKEKETLLQEIHHRVKNNMQVISSLLKMQMRSTDDKKTETALQDSQLRIQAMSYIHETLYGSDNLSSIEMKNYFLRLLSSIEQSYSNNMGRVKTIVDAGEITLGVKQATPVGLIINELVSNSYKYAFPDDKEGEINLQLTESDHEIEMIYSDNGIGIPEDFDWYNTKSLGLNLVKLLSENQLSGSLEMKRENGTCFVIRFKKKEDKPTEAAS